MRAAVFHQAGKPLALDKIDDPKPRPTDVIIRVHRCGICGTDLHLTSGGAWDFPAGSIPGHEFVGDIVEVGSEVEGYRKGDVITSVPTVGCGACLACHHGTWPLCDAMEPVMGGFGEYMRIPTRSAIRLPSTYTPADGALVEPFAVGLFGVRTAAPSAGDRVLILGAGTVALTTTFWAKRLGAGRVVLLSRAERRAPMSLACGADAFVQAGPEEHQNVVEALGGPPDIVFECVGATGQLEKAVMHVRKFGKVVSMGYCTDPDPLTPAICANKAPQFSFPVGYSRRDFEYVADNMLAGTIDPKVMVTSTVPFTDLPVVFDKLRGPNTDTKVHVALVK